MTIYDRLLGTYTPADRAAAVVYGLGDADPLRTASFSGLLSIPLQGSNDAALPDTKVRIAAGAGR